MPSPHSDQSASLLTRQTSPVSVPTNTPPVFSGSTVRPWKLATLGEWAASHSERHDSPPFSERKSIASAPFSWP